jgi:acyl-CoA synthetase (AMP-forming)/AMP-acid ligase II
LSTTGRPPQTGDEDPYPIRMRAAPTTTHEHAEEAVDVGSSLLRWLDDPDMGRGIHFADGAGGWAFRSYAELAGSVAEAAGTLANAGLGTGGVVCIAVPGGPEFVAAFFGSLIAGGIPSPMAPPLIFRSAEEYLSHLVRLLRAASPSMVVSDADLLPVVAGAVEAAGLKCGCLCLSLAGERCDLSARPPAGLALLQFTSGSSGNPRGVRISWANLETQVAALHEWVRWRQDDSVASWLPLYHDMGLIGVLLSAAVHRSNLWLLRPEHFLRSPALWLECLGRFGATITASPSFGYAYAANKVTASELKGMDFSRWRVAAVAAERVDPAALDRFARLVAPHGFRREAFLPGYGLAEATLALTGSSLDALPMVAAVDRVSLRFGGPVRVLERGVLDRAGDGGRGDWLVGCGRPLPGIRLWIVDATGAPLGEGRLGEIVASGPCVAEGYQGVQAGSPTRFAPGGLYTGDAGFLLDGELFVLGRMGDSTKVRGRSLYAEDVEARLAAIPGVPAGRLVVVFGRFDGLDTVAAVVEREPGAWVEPAARRLRSETGRSTRVLILEVPRHTIPRTSSGKPRRRLLGQELMEGTLHATTLVDWRGGGA